MGAAVQCLLVAASPSTLSRNAQGDPLVSRRVASFAPHRMFSNGWLCKGFWQRSPGMPWIYALGAAAVGFFVAI